MAYGTQTASSSFGVKERSLTLPIAGVLAAGTLAAFFLLIALQIQRPYIYDDVSFAVAAQAVANTGLPFANAGYMGDRYDFSQREQWALWHPPLYIFLLGAWYKILGFSDAVGRAFGVVCTLISAGLVAYLAGMVAGRALAGATALLAAALFLLNPLTIQSALVLDIDGTVLTVLVTGLVVLYVRHVLDPRPWDMPVLVMVFALALWAKMTTPLGLLFAIAGYRLLEGRPLLALREVLTIGVAGAAIFLTTYTLACRLLGMPWDLPFATLWQEFIDASESTKSWRESIDGFLTAITPSGYWISPALMILGGAAVVTRVREIVETRRPHVVDIAIVMALGVYVVYLIKLAGLFPKYHISAMPFICVIAAWVATRALDRSRLPDLAVYGFGLLVFTAYFWRAVPTDWASESFRGPLGALLLERPGALAILLVAVAFLLRGGPIGRHATAVVVVLALGWSLGMGYRQARAAYSTNYWYGSHGQVETAAALDAMVSPDEFWGGAKEVAYYAKNKNYIDQDSIHYWIQEYGGFTERPLTGHRPRVLAVWTGHTYIAFMFHEAMAHEYEPVVEIGTYTILVRRS